MENQVDIEKIKAIIFETLKVERIDPFQLYLFGSRARGNFSANSDYDLMIISKEKIGIKEKMRLFTKLRKVLAKERYNVDIVIKSTNEANYYKNKIGHIVRTALSEGILI
ncbi:MAG: uncharacterized protein QG657_2864 [Acidobacteriota bacterium]|nr:uncharacterized protein [Acidobacteriota bacterium]